MQRQNQNGQNTKLTRDTKSNKRVLYQYIQSDEGKCGSANQWRGRSTDR